jgi:hypothetical protein
MDPISITVEIELATLLLAVVGAVASWSHARQQRAIRRQHDRHFREMRALRAEMHREHMAVLRRHDGAEIADNSAPVEATKSRSAGSPPAAASRARRRGSADA